MRGAAVATASAGAVTSLDGTRLFAAEDAGGDTILRTVDTRTGQVVGEYKLRGRWAPRAAPVGGQRVALTAPPAAGASPFLPAGRKRTEILIATPGKEVARLDLAGNLVPDTFDTSGNGLYVLDWLPPTAPHHYRVRWVDLIGGAVIPLNTIAKTPVPQGAEEEMSGEGRLAVYSPRQGMLFTLYTHQPDHQHTRDLIADRRSNVHAFVHSLNLTQRWAYCVDLPAPFGEGDGSTHTIAEDQTGRSLYVYDGASGSLAVVDTENLALGSPQPPQVVTVPRAAGTAYAAAATQRVFLGGDAAVHVVRPDGSVIATWKVADKVRGLGVSADGSRLYVGQSDRVLMLDATSGRQTGWVAVPGLVALRRAL
ncbi:hypothetical protein GCM10009682_38380 [Luedemannella flava]|uniref:Uncharacterized protein n=1 Tax=Luedemannella flava TaxID=349316 RepID=A0ABN2M7R9_9ACTN